jgi:hypothetical protein
MLIFDNMKKQLLSISLALLVAFSISSCKDESTDPQPTNNNNGNGGNTSGVVGVWTLVSIEQKDGQVTWDGEEVSTYTAQSRDESGTVEFKSDGTFSGLQGYTFDVTTTSFLGTDESSTEIPPTTTSGTYTHDATANTMTTVSNGVSTTANLTTLTATKMVQELAVSTTQEVQGITVVSKNTTIATYSK